MKGRDERSRGIVTRIADDFAIIKPTRNSVFLLQQNKKKAKARGNMSRFETMMSKETDKV